MPNEQRTKEQGSSDLAASSPVSWWQKFHFSGKVIMCSVLFGLGLVLIGGLLTAIGMSHNDEAHNQNLSEIQNKAPMSIVGFIIVGIGGFTVVVGVTMCLFETNICRKRQPDVRPLIDDQNKTSNNSDPTTIPSTSQKKGKHRHHKKHISPRKHKDGKISVPSTPIDVHRNISAALTASDKFVTPASSFVTEKVQVHATNSDAEIQTSASLLNSFMSSGKSSELDFQTPSSSLQDSSGSFQNQNELQGIPPEISNSEVSATKRLKNLKHDFLTPKSSNAEILDSNSGSEEETVLVNSHQAKNHSKLVLEALKQKGLHHEKDILSHDFLTPTNSYVEPHQLPEKIIENQNCVRNPSEYEESALAHSLIEIDDSSHLENVASIISDDKNNTKQDRLEENKIASNNCVDEFLVQSEITDFVADNSKENEEVREVIDVDINNDKPNEVNS